jgi:uncharacterized coiled-coil protein SlyX
MDKAATDKEIEVCVRELNTCVVTNTKKLDKKLEELKAAIKKLEKEKTNGAS